MNISDLQKEIMDNSISYVKEGGTLIYSTCTLTEEENMGMVKYILDNAKLSNDDIKLFYARLMFPTIYFDTLESILLDNKNESELNIFIETLPKYLNLLKDTYLEIKKSISIDIPNWIIKN